VVLRVDLAIFSETLKYQSVSESLYDERVEGTHTQFADDLTRYTPFAIHL